jgi:hydroxymethylglutaryl-CoA synthase
VPPELNVGIAGYGAYVPALRLDRGEAAGLHKWLSPELDGENGSERSVGSWDEDVVTMAVEAGRECLLDVPAETVSKLLLATTTSPFTDLLCSSLAAAALDLRPTAGTQDVTGSVRAGTTALVSALESATALAEPVLCVASDRRRAAPASAAELSTGHAAAAVLVAPGAGVARLLGTASISTNLVDHYRTALQESDYVWEERWVRDEGYMKLVPSLIEMCLQSSGTPASSVTQFCMPSPSSRVTSTVAKASRIPVTAVQDALSEGCGDSGAAHPLLMLVHALESAAPGDKILIIRFGQGGDALLFEATDALANYQKRHYGVSKWLRRRIACSYSRYAVLNGILKPDRGIRAEIDKATAMTAMYRHRELIFGFKGGRCMQCGTHQIPRTRICCNSKCGAVDAQALYSFANSTGHIMSWSADRLTYTPDPPAYYGAIDFEEGARLMMDFTDMQPGSVDVGSAMRMVFRIKDLDRVRGFSRYFWKAAPVHLGSN